MKVNLFVVTLGTGDDPPWVVGAWDEWTVDENYQGYAEAVEKLEKEHGANFRVGVVEVPDSFLSDCFKCHTVKAKVSP